MTDLRQAARCRNDGRCQYAIDHGAEDLGHCPPNKCVMPDTEAPSKCAKPSLSCPNMKDRENDTSMSYEHYDCKVCGGHIALDYDDMR